MNNEENKSETGIPSTIADSLLRYFVKNQQFDIDGRNIAAQDIDGSYRYKLDVERRLTLIEVEQRHIGEKITEHGKQLAEILSIIKNPTKAVNDALLQEAVRNMQKMEDERKNLKKWFLLSIASSVIALLFSIIDSSIKSRPQENNKAPQAQEQIQQR